jgi:SpoVK/Ycf46/Vps4 family AAA+-type ATPase
MLFAGPPGTGKTLAAEAVAHELGRPLLRINSSDVVTCWWGESEKNAERVFKHAEKEEAVLLFDEADSYFYRRGGGERSIDQSSNRLVNVFLACIETYNLPVILTTNRAGALDEALERRLSFKVEFPLPGPRERARIWKLHLPKEMPLAKGVDVKALAGEYPLTGGQIKNAVLAAARKAAYRVTRAGGSGRVSMADLEEACREELAGSVVMGTAERVVGFTV